MKGWTPQAAEQASRPASVPRNERTPPPATSASSLASSKPQGQPKEPAEKHVQLPPPPADKGPWQVGAWIIRRATAYAPDARVSATGPDEEFDRFLAHLQAFQP